MKASNHFRNTIKEYLDRRAEIDVSFSAQYTKPEKNIDDCITYIFNTVQTSGCNGFTDDEVYSMAVHYYDEDNVEVGKPINAYVVVNHVVELTAEEKEEARLQAIQKVKEDTYTRIKQRAEKPKTKQVQPNNEPNLFNF
jgi:hypothetical protein